MTVLHDRLWLWCHNAGVYNFIEKLNDFSDCSPADAAAYFDIANILMVVYGDKPEPPFEPIQQGFDHLKQVVWSIIGDAGSRRNVEKTDIDEVVELRRKHPNIAGGIMDDFFNPNRPDFGIAEISRRMKEAALPLWIVLYDHEVDRPDLPEKLALCDVVTFWTWDPANLHKLDENIAKVKAAAPDKRIVQGCYLWNFNQTGELTLDHMEFQCGKALEYLRSGIIQDIIILGSPLVGMKLPTLEWTRNWIAENFYS